MRANALGVFLLASCMAALPAWAQQNQPPAPDQPSDSSQPPPAEQQDPQAAPAAPAQAVRPLPATLLLPAGAIVAARTGQWLSSDRNHAGDTFSAVLDQPLVVNGWVVARRGQTVIGRVDVAQKAGEGKGISRLGLEITELTLVDGEQIPVSTQMQQAAPAPVAPGPPNATSPPSARPRFWAPSSELRSAAARVPRLAPVWERRLVWLL